LKRSIAALRGVDARLLAILDELEQVTSSQKIDAATLARERWKLALVRRERQALIDAIGIDLARVVEGSDRETLNRLRATSRDIAAASSEHIRQWTPEAMTLNARAYDTAVRSMRRLWRENIHDEQAILSSLVRRRAQ
jgi:hypothetical protein